MQSILITGANGFVGRQLMEKLPSFGLSLIGLCRQLSNDQVSTNVLPVGDLAEANLEQFLDGVDVVIHAAALAHVSDSRHKEVLGSYRRANVEATINIAKQALNAGIKRFIYISSIKVNGERTVPGKPFSEEFLPNPEDAYGISKFEAEQFLINFFKDTPVELVIIRPPLIYGPNVKANFLNLLKIASLKLPLPFGSIHNKRSMIFVDNLVDFIALCIRHPAAANETFLISDGDDVSLTRLLSLLRRDLDIPKLLVPIPSVIFRGIGLIIGKRALIDRLIGNLEVDVSKAVRTLEWRPSFTVKEGIAATVADFKKRNM